MTIKQLDSQELNRILLSLCTLLLGITIILSNVQVSDSVLSNKILVTVKAEKDTITEGAFPVMLGTVKDQSYKSISNANMLISFGTVIITTIVILRATLDTNLPRLLLMVCTKSMLLHQK